MLAPRGAGLLGSGVALLALMASLPGGSALLDILRDHAQKFGFEPLDVSNHLCWVGEWTLERCCQGDATTQTDCWKDHFSFAECCPNADCWNDPSVSYAQCCDTSQYGPEGNPSCWEGVYTYEHCCLANRPGQQWVDVAMSHIDTRRFFSMDEFYTDAQYGDDFGYYSTGRVLKAKGSGEAQQFAHFTTYPMALSPHFGRVICRLLLVMWIHSEERSPFRVVEMGAGSGQLAFDIERCVRSNELGMAPDLWRRWSAAFEYLIMERSPALLRRQQQRGLRVVLGDAQSEGSCEPILAALADSVACQGHRGDLSDLSSSAAADGGETCSAIAPECQAGSSGTGASGAAVVLSNELLDAFAPVKLLLSVYDDPDVTDCDAWYEMRLLHFLDSDDFVKIARTLEHSEAWIQTIFDDLSGFTSRLLCSIRNTTIGQAAAACSPTSGCLEIALALAEISGHVDLHLPAAAHNMRLRLRKDSEVCRRIRSVAEKLAVEMAGVVVLPKQVYRQFRHRLSENPDAEVFFLAKVHTRQVPVSLSPERCEELSWWFSMHEARLLRFLDLYRPLGYPAIHVLIRPGEQTFVELADCLIGNGSGFVLSIDYGASFEALGHSLTVDPSGDGIFIPPVPQELLLDLPDCFGSWTTCAGRIDWTSFVDFTNVAEAGKHFGWRTLAYGPQSILEQISHRHIVVGGVNYSVPGYAVLAHEPHTRQVQNWYGHEILTSDADTTGWDQRWTSFKALLMEKPRSTSGAAPPRPPPPVVLSPSWHLDSAELSRCWRLDPATLPLTDWLRRQSGQDPRTALRQVSTEMTQRLAREYSDAYEEAQLSVRLVDWLVASEGCGRLQPKEVASLLDDYDDRWLELRRRLLLAWQEIWGAEAVERVALAVLRRLALAAESSESSDSLSAALLRLGEASPAECLGAEAYAALCLAPGDAAQVTSRLYAPT